jgi:surface antigen
MKIAVTVTLCAGLILSGCAGDTGPKELGGAAAGGAVGGLLASQIFRGSGSGAGIAAGAVLGALLGQSAGKSLDRADRISMQQAQARAYNAPVGQQITWSNPETGNSGSYTPLRDGRSASGEQCREFQQTIIVGGKPESGYGTACLQRDGSWKIVQ